MRAWITDKDGKWGVGWYTPQGKRRSRSFGPGSKGKALAEKFREKVTAELLTGTYEEASKTTWDDFVKSYESRVLEGKSIRTLGCALSSLRIFRRIVNPKSVCHVSTDVVDRFIAARRQEPGDKPGSKISPATINHDLRHIKAALRVAHEWGLLEKLPKFRMERELKSIPLYVTGDHFAMIYQHAGNASANLKRKRRRPEVQGVDSGDWWRALIVFAYMTGWRIGEMLSLERPDLNLDSGFAITRAESNKGKRDDKIKLHDVVVAHLRRIQGHFGDRVFPWPHDETTLRNDLARIQEAAGVRLDCREKHKHTRHCHVYSFHDFRRAFATMNADRLSADALQKLMRHKSYQTTQVYINLARQMDEAVQSLHVPDVLKQA